MYALLRRLLFACDPAKAQHIALKSLTVAHACGLTSSIYPTVSAPKTCMGLRFENPIGLAAGLDDNADYVDALGALGFGFIEVGGVTPRPQAGNPSPNLFRLVPQRAVINRKGLRNKGVTYVAQQLAKRRYRGIVGVNIAKNKETPNAKALDDYLTCFQALWSVADYITINISSPNTPELRALQETAYLTPLLSALKNAQANVQAQQGKYVPLLVKISPDLANDALDELAEILLIQQMDGVIATNTTLDRSLIADSPYAQETGGLSGAPLTARSTAVLAHLHRALQNKIPLIGVGGVMDEPSAQAKRDAGAELLQIYTGLLYAGPGLIGRLAHLFR